MNMTVGANADIGLFNTVAYKKDKNVLRGHPEMKNQTFSKSN